MVTAMGETSSAPFRMVLVEMTSTILMGMERGRGWSGKRTRVATVSNCSEAEKGMLRALFHSEITS